MSKIDSVAIKAMACSAVAHTERSLKGALKHTSLRACGGESDL